jgi:hypothetical protein
MTIKLGALVPPTRCLGPVAVSERTLAIRPRTVRRPDLRGRGPRATRRRGRTGSGTQRPRCEGSMRWISRGSP